MPVYRGRVERRQRWLAALVADACPASPGRGPALAHPLLAVAAVLAALGSCEGGARTPIGDTQAGRAGAASGLRAYNRDNDVHYAPVQHRVDVLTAIVESTEPVCVSHDLMSAVDRFGWHMRNVAGVQDVITLPFIAKIAIAGWNEGSLKWRSIPREQTQLTQSTRYIETSTGLLNDKLRRRAGDDVPGRPPRRHDRARRDRSERLAQRQPGRRRPDAPRRGERSG